MDKLWSYLFVRPPRKSSLSITEFVVSSCPLWRVNNRLLWPFRKANGSRSAQLFSLDFSHTLFYLQASQVSCCGFLKLMVLRICGRWKHNSLHFSTENLLFEISCEFFSWPSISFWMKSGFWFWDHLVIGLEILGHKMRYSGLVLLLDKEIIDKFFLLFFLSVFDLGVFWMRMQPMIYDFRPSLDSG